MAKPMAMKKRRLLSDLFKVDGAQAVRGEAQRTLNLISPGFGEAPVERMVAAACRLYEGAFPGYRGCSTGYHDLRHTLEVFLTLARLIHGAVGEGQGLGERDVVLALAAALFHDAGYIPLESEGLQQGAGFREDHETRGIDFIARHAADLGLSAAEAAAAGSLIRCTDLAEDIGRLPFAAARFEHLGRMLAAADLLAQLSDPVYLEKLSELYREDREGGGRRYADYPDALTQALRFYGFFKQRLAETLPEHGRFLSRHFAARWGIAEDLCARAIERQHAYLAAVLAEGGEVDSGRFRRSGTAAHQARLFARRH